MMWSAPGAYKVDRTWIAEDCSGNQTTHTQTITVVDLVAPVISGGEDYSPSAMEKAMRPSLANWLAGPWRGHRHGRLRYGDVEPRL